MHCATWHVPVACDLTNLLTAAECLIRFGSDRRRSKQASDGNMFFYRHLDIHEMALAIQLDEIASRTQTGSPIEKGEAAFDSPLRKENGKISNASLCSES